MVAQWLTLRWWCGETSRAADQLTRLTSVLADRYSIQEELGAGGTWMNIE